MLYVLYINVCNPRTCTVKNVNAGTYYRTSESLYPLLGVKLGLGVV